MRKFLLDNSDIVVITTYDNLSNTIESGVGDVVVPTSKEILNSDFDCRMTIYDRIPDVTIIREL